MLSTEEKIKEAIESFCSLPGNKTFSEELFKSFYKHLRERYTVYEELADVAGLKETATPNCWVKKGGVSYFTLTKNGFIDITLLQKP